MRQLFLVCAKLIGILQIYWGVAQLTPLATYTALRISYSDDAANGFIIPWAGLVMVCQILMAIVFASFLLMRTEKVADFLMVKEDDALSLPPVHELLGTGTKLIGLWVIVTAVPELIHTFAEPKYFSGMPGEGPSFSINMMPAILKILLGAFLISRTTVIVRWLTPRPSTLPDALTTNEPAAE